MVLIQLLLPTGGAASADRLAPLAQTRRELADRFTGVVSKPFAIVAVRWRDPKLTQISSEPPTRTARRR
jgi:hypothetical protein